MLRHFVVILIVSVRGIQQQSSYIRIGQNLGVNAKINLKTNIAEIWGTPIIAPKIKLWPTSYDDQNQFLFLKIMTILWEKCIVKQIIVINLRKDHE